MRECNFSYFSVFCTQLIKPRTKLWKILAPPGVAPIQQNRFQLCTINCTEKLHWNEIYFYLALFTSLMTFSQTNFSLSLSIYLSLSFFLSLSYLSAIHWVWCWWWENPPGFFVQNAQATPRHSHAHTQTQTPPGPARLSNH